MIITAAMPLPANIDGHSVVRSMSEATERTNTPTMFMNDDSDCHHGRSEKRSVQGDVALA
jgi:hypothetical protein